MDGVPVEAKVAANPRDHQARFDLALALNARDKREEAVVTVIEQAEAVCRDWAAAA